MHACSHFRGQKNKHGITRLLEEKNEFLHCQAVHDNGFGEVVSAQAVHCSKA